MISSTLKSQLSVFKKIYLMLSLHFKNVYTKNCHFFLNLVNFIILIFWFVIWIKLFDSEMRSTLTDMRPILAPKLNCSVPARKCVLYTVNCYNTPRPRPAHHSHHWSPQREERYPSSALYNKIVFLAFSVKWVKMSLLE